MLSDGRISWEGHLRLEMASRARSAGRRFDVPVLPGRWPPAACPSWLAGHASTDGGGARRLDARVVIACGHQSMNERCLETPCLAFIHCGVSTSPCEGSRWPGLLRPSIATQAHVKMR